MTKNLIFKVLKADLSLVPYGIKEITSYTKVDDGMFPALIYNGNPRSIVHISKKKSTFVVTSFWFTSIIGEPQKDRILKCNREGNTNFLFDIATGLPLSTSMFTTKYAKKTASAALFLSSNGDISFVNLSLEIRRAFFGVNCYISNEMQENVQPKTDFKRAAIMMITNYLGKQYDFDVKGIKIINGSTEIGERNIDSIIEDMFVEAPDDLPPILLSEVMNRGFYHVVDYIMESTNERLPAVITIDVFSESYKKVIITKEHKLKFILKEGTISHTKYQLTNLFKLKINDVQLVKGEAI